MEFEIFKSFKTIVAIFVINFQFAIFIPSTWHVCSFNCPSIFNELEINKLLQTKYKKKFNWTVHNITGSIKWEKKMKWNGMK